MKRVVILAALLCCLSFSLSAQVPWMKGKTPVPYQKKPVDSTKVAEPVPPPDTLLATVTLTLDTSLLSPSYYLRSSANSHKREFWFGVLSGGFAGLAVASEDARALCGISAGVFGVLALINHFQAISDMKKASKSLSRVHLTAGGVTIDL
jgi:hypothetical protein